MVVNVVGKKFLDKKRPVWTKMRGNEFVVHHECDLHKFHIIFPCGNWKLCDCDEE
jgi:aminoglycoside phosphotransferase family enzyme